MPSLPETVTSDPSAYLRFDQRVAHTHALEPAEVAVCTQQLMNAMVNAQRGDASVVDLRAVRARRRDRRADDTPVARLLG